MTPQEDLCILISGLTAFYSRHYLKWEKIERKSQNFSEFHVHFQPDWQILAHRAAAGVPEIL